MSEVLLSHNQLNFYTSDKGYTLYCGGIGAGKTHAGAIWAISMALAHPDTIGLITANSYSQLKKATLTKLFQLLTEMCLPFKYKSQEGIIQIGKAVIYTISMEKYDLLRGVEVGWAWSDECAFYREEAYDVLIGRIRDRAAPCLWKGTTTPNGFNWLYKKFVSEPISNSTVVYGSTRENLDNLRPDYVANLEEQYDPKLAQQELDGQFVNLNSGAVYYSFDRRMHCKSVKADIHDPFWVGLDFNVHPMCGVYCVVRGDTIHVVKELYQLDSNTFKAAKQLATDVPVYKTKVVADETGGFRRTSSNKTDHEILRRAGFEVMRFHNPQVKDRYNNLNRLFHQGRIIIHPDCKKLIEDLEQMVYENKDPMLSHASDALGYVAWHLFPLKKPRRDASVNYY